MQVILRLFMSSLITTTCASVYAGDCKEQEISPKSLVTTPKISLTAGNTHAIPCTRVVTEDDVYAQKPLRTYTSTLAGACRQAADELAACNTAILTIAVAQPTMKVEQLNKSALLKAFMSAQTIYEEEEKNNKVTSYTYTTAKIPELFAHIAPKLLANNKHSHWTQRLGLTPENNNAYALIQTDDCVGLNVETMTRYKGNKINNSYPYTHSTQKKDK